MSAGVQPRFAAPRPAAWHSGLFTTLCACGASLLWLLLFRGQTPGLSGLSGLSGPGGLGVDGPVLGGAEPLLLAQSSTLALALPWIACGPRWGRTSGALSTDLSRASLGLLWIAIGVRDDVAAGLAPVWVALGLLCVTGLSALAISAARTRGSLQAVVWCVFWIAPLPALLSKFFSWTAPDALRYLAQLSPWGWAAFARLPLTLRDSPWLACAWLVPMAWIGLRREGSDA